MASVRRVAPAVRSLRSPFVEGSCVLGVGDSTDGANPQPPVTAGALKVYGRTAHATGVCT
jgi:hypothetical protein